MADASAQLSWERIEEPRLQVLETKGVETKSVPVGSTGTRNELVMKPAISSLGSIRSEGAVTLEKASECQERATGTSSPSPSSPGNSPQSCREKVVYLDDAEEVQSPLEVNMNYQDQRLFKFKHSLALQREMPEEGYSEESDSWDESPVMEASRKIHRGLEERTRRGSTFQDNRSTESTGFANYYNGRNENLDHKSRPNTQMNEHQKKGKASCGDGSVGSEMKLDQLGQHSIKPHEKNNLEDVVKKPLMSEPKSAAPPPKKDRICSENVAVVYDVFTYLGYKPSKGHAEMKQTEEGSIYETDSSRSTDDDCGLPPYSRAMTMPPERPEEVQSEKIPRSNSCPLEHPNHVHPKLPDYDEIAAKFSALRKEYLRSKG